MTQLPEELSQQIREYYLSQLIERPPNTNGEQFCELMFGGWEEFQDVCADLVIKHLNYRFMAMVDEFEANNVTEDDIDAGSEIILKHFPGDVELFMSILKEIDDKYMHSFLIFGIAMCRGAIDRLLPSIFKSNPVQFIKQVVEKLAAN